MAALTSLIRAMAGLIFVGLLTATSWLGYVHYMAPDPELEAAKEELALRQARIEQLGREVAAQEKEIERLEVAVRLLKVDRRIARVQVLEQWKSDESDRLKTKLEFVEVDEQGRPLGQPQTFTIVGDKLYVEYWVVKFRDEFVEAGDELRGTSIALFRRIFGEYQQPAEGFEIDRVGSQPVAYGEGTTTSEFERNIWENFWKYASRPELAESMGIRAAHGDALLTRLEEGRTYRIVLRSTGELTVTPEEPASSAQPEA